MRLPTIFIALFVLGGCTLGPGYHGPPPVTAVTAGFVRMPGAATASSPSLAHWWTSFGDPVLNGLEERALRDHPSVAVAEARLRQARAAALLDRANKLPKNSASALYLHGELPPTNLGLGNNDGGRSALDFYNLGFDASWELDLFGAASGTVRATAAEAEAAETEVDDARLSLSADVAQAYLKLRDRQARLNLARLSTRLHQEEFASLNRRVAAGTAPTLESQQLEPQIAQSNGNVRDLATECDALLNALAVLTGQAPGALDGELAATATTTVPLPPASVPVGDPSGLLRRRPDIRGAERQLAARTARIGVAEAARFPRVSLMGLVGLGGSKPGDVLAPSNISLLALPRLSWSFLDFGRNAARVRQATGARDEAEARYREVILQALGNAEDALSRFGRSRSGFGDALSSRATALAIAGRADRAFAAGTIRRQEMLEYRRKLLTAEDALLQAKTAVGTDFVALQKSLGLGWEPQLEQNQDVQ
ncbi:RND transporter [Sphingomonas sp. Leaf67]|uniref:efflux transporter outer membrane subunit n=1 Tax=Sphingomonas sp. Leaf67 TaxID=1736230 RepID=UPI0006F9A663|nr:efflux transporter outer membrane subunit [Sphingomonas sp. Leaf67]KQN90746.1 RND transporter [Sphingomonas sp. Leaf67]